MRLRRERESRAETLHGALTALALAAAMAAPALAQETGVQRVWLSFEETAQVGAMLVGSGVAEVGTSSTGATTAGGTLSWVKYMEKSDDLGMRHVYYRQQYNHPALGRQLRVTGTAASLHYAPDGALRWANVAQLTDLAANPPLTLSTAEGAFAAAQGGLATWPGFALGSPAAWAPGTLANLLDEAELTLAPAPAAAGGVRARWRVQTLDAGRHAWNVLLDAGSGALVAVTSVALRECWQRPTCADCESNPVNVAAWAKPENEDLDCGPGSYSCNEDGVRELFAHYCPEPSCEYYRYYDNPQDSCKGPCTHEAAMYIFDGTKIEVWYYVPNMAQHLHCGQPQEGDFMRVGLKTWNNVPYYGPYKGATVPLGHQPSTKMRQWAGDAMFHTMRTMETFSSELNWCGVDGSCGAPYGTARVVVDTRSTNGGAYFMPVDTEQEAPMDSVGVDMPGLGDFSQSAALDILAHEWGHGVDWHSPAKFAAMPCDESPEPCQIAEGFADVIGHFVEHKVHTNPGPGFETHDWDAGEDWDSDDDRLRTANAFDERLCASGGWHWSVHANDAGCEDGQDSPASHNNGNRLAVVFRLLAEGGQNPGLNHGISPCTGCDIVVEGLGLDDAAQILWRVLTLQADGATNDWDYLPWLARAAAYDRYHNRYPPCAEEFQQSVIDAFSAVGYPENLPTPTLMGCGPGQPLPCPPYCDE